MSRWSLAHDATTASLFAGFVAALERDPGGWEWPASTAHYLRFRLATLAAVLLLDGATLTEVA